MKWRMTFVEGGYSAITKDFNLTAEKSIVGRPTVGKNPRMELRRENGAIIRVGTGGEFTLVDSPLGEAPQLYGEVLVIKENPAKYRTSCWGLTAPTSGSIDYFVRPIPGKDADEYFALLGDLVISEFDENGKSYLIAYVSEGTSVVVNYQAQENGLNKYSADSPSAITDKDYDYILTNYIDPRKWR